MKFSKIIFSSLMLAVLYGIIVYILMAIDATTVMAIVLGGAAIVGATALTFTVTDMIWPKSAALHAVDVKTFLSSKIFWLAVLNLLAVTTKGLFNIDVDPDTQFEIVNLDWTNILQAVVSILLIAIRKFDLLKLLK